MNEYYITFVKLTRETVKVRADSTAEAVSIVRDGEGEQDCKSIDHDVESLLVIDALPLEVFSALLAGARP